MITKTTKHRRPKMTEKINEKYENSADCIEEAKEKFLQLEGVIGVGYGPKETGGQILEDGPSIIVYVAEKKDENALRPEEMIPSHLDGVLTDVVQPGHRSIPKLNEFDSMWLDRAKIHARNPYAEVNLEPRVDYDLDEVAVLEIDDTFVTGNNIDFVKATKRFLASHSDVFDFITFYVDASTGLPSQGSYHSGIYNKATGINYYAGSNLDKRSSFGSTKLLAFLSIGWIGNAVLLQEFGHMWGAYVRNRDSETDARRYDLLIGSTGQGVFHWGRFFDNDHSPMDYDGIDWQELGGNQFQSHGIANDFFHFHPLDLYLMGLLPRELVGSFYVIQNPSANSGTITGTKKNLTVQNVIWSEGERDPAYPDTQKEWKQAFVVLTKDAHASHAFVQQVVNQRREFTWELYKAMRFLGKVDTTLRPIILFPEIKVISVSVDDDKALIGWKTNVRTRGRVNYATSPDAFRRDQAHAEPFSTVAVSTFSTSQGVLLTGLSPNKTYYYEIIAETEQGLFHRMDPQNLYTRRTNDPCAPDINNVSVGRGKRNSLLIRWHTDEPASSLITYGFTNPPTASFSDPYPTIDHSFTLRGLAPGTYSVKVESRDAAGNATTDDNNGNYYQVVMPPSAVPIATLGLAPSDESTLTSSTINAAVEAGEIDEALANTSKLLLEEGKREIASIAQSLSLPENDLEAGYRTLVVLARRMNATLTAVEQGSDFVDFVVDPDPLHNITWINLPGDLVAEEAGYPVLTKIISSLRESLKLEPHPTKGSGYYRLSSS